MNERWKAISILRGIADDIESGHLRTLVQKRIEKRSTVRPAVFRDWNAFTVKHILDSLFDGTRVDG
jgi:hypothetical protein